LAGRQYILKNKGWGGHNYAKSGHDISCPYGKSLELCQDFGREEKRHSGEWRSQEGELFMPELPDITVYIEALEKRILGARLERVRIVSPFLLRTVEPPVASVEGKKVVELRRVGKRICIGLESGNWLVLHLMIAGRLHWHGDEGGTDEKLGRKNGGKSGRETVKLGGRQHLAAFDFSNGTLAWTEAGSQKRASLHLAAGEEGLRELDPGGAEVLKCSLAEFAEVLRSENHTLKRALTDARWFSGIGNAYSDEILWAAKLSPTTLTQKMKDEDVARLFEATRETLREWVERLRAETGEKFPEKVTAFRAEMAVHGKYKQACPRCGSKIQRIKYASNETNYCATCQTGGKLLADRAFSRLLREDWPRTLEELEMKMGAKKDLPQSRRDTEK
jgi:formamidopyrimidine-DNA glycosylase